MKSNNNQNRRRRQFEKGMIQARILRNSDVVFITVKDTNLRMNFKKL